MCNPSCSETASANQSLCIICKDQGANFMVPRCEIKLSYYLGTSQFHETVHSQRLCDTDRTATQRVDTL